MPRKSRHLLYAALFTGALPWWVGAQQPDPTTGTVTGHIVEASSQRPLSDVQVRIVGTQRGGITNEQGDYRITGVALGAVTLRAQRIGYAPITQSVTVTAGAPLPVNFALSTTAIQI